MTSRPSPGVAQNYNLLQGEDSNMYWAFMEVLLISIIGFQFLIHVTLWWWMYQAFSREIGELKAKIEPTEYADVSVE